MPMQHQLVGGNTLQPCHLRCCLLPADRAKAHFFEGMGRISGAEWFDAAAACHAEQLGPQADAQGGPPLSQPLLEPGQLLLEPIQPRLLAFIDPHGPAHHHGHRWFLGFYGR